MKIPKFKTETEESETELAAEEKDEVQIIDRPRICCVDIKAEVRNALIAVGYNVHTGTLGEKIIVPNLRRNEDYQVLPNYEFPKNLHEFDIIILDLGSFETRQYEVEDHTRKTHTGRTSNQILCSFPETLFDPRPLGSLMLGEKLSKFGKKPFLVLAFTTSNYSVDYQLTVTNERHTSLDRTLLAGIYDFMKDCPLSSPKVGQELSVCEIKDNFKNLLESHIASTKYNQIFNHPTRWENGEHRPKAEWVPLIKNASDEIVSISHFDNNSSFYLLPQIKLKDKFLVDFLSNIAPDFHPLLFPYSTTFSWTDKKEYWLPSHGDLLGEKRQIEENYRKEIVRKETEISRNKEKYAFLHEILTSSGDKLTNSLVHYFKWLGFEKVTNYDKEKENEPLEEDIQVELDDGLLIIECKGIGGTSTDSDCSQISKIKHRRCQQRNRFDVYALYVVNHQIYLPPLNRRHPPFTENQIQNAINDERGLLSTWQLFNLYFEIEKGIFTKEEGQKRLLEFGRVEFRPSNIIHIDTPDEILKEGTVCIINIDGIELNIGENILVERNGQFDLVTIDGIQIDDKPMDSANEGEIGLLLSAPIRKKSILWKYSK